MPISAVDLSKPVGKQTVNISSSNGGTQPSSGGTSISPVFGGKTISPVNLKSTTNSTSSIGSAFQTGTPTQTFTPTAPAQQQQPNILQKVGSAISGAAQDAAKSAPALALKNTFDALISTRNKINSGVSEAFKAPFGAPAQAPTELQPGYDPVKTAVVEKKYGVTGTSLEQNQQDFNISMLGEQNRVFGEAGASLIKGVTNHIINPDVAKPESAIDSIIQGAFEGAGKFYTISKLSQGAGSVFGETKIVGEGGQVVSEGSGLLGRSELITNIVQRFPSAAEFLPEAAKTVVGFNVYSQLDPEKKDRLRSLISDTSTAVGQAALSGAKAVVSVPGSFILGAGTTKLDGGSNKEAFMNGMVFMALDVTGRLGDTKALIERDGVEPLLKEKAIGKLNEHLETPLSKNASPEEISKAFREIRGKLVNPDLPNATPEDIKAVTEVNNAYNLLRGKLSGNATTDTTTPEVNKDVHTFTPDELKIQTTKTDLQGTPAAERLDTIIASAQQVGKDIQVDLTGKTGIPIGTPDGNKIGVTLVDRGQQQTAANDNTQVAFQTNAVSEKPAVTDQSAAASTKTSSGALAVETSKVPSGADTAIQGTESNVKAPIAQSGNSDIISNNNDKTISDTSSEAAKGFTPVTKEDLSKSAQNITESKQPSTADIPHKEGFSRLQERLEEQLLNSNGDKYNWSDTNRTYNKVGLKEDAQKAVDLLKNDPEKAMRIAQGYDPSSSGDPLEFNVSNAVALKAFNEGNAALGTKIMNRLSQTATRYGQNIVSLRGNFNDNTPQNFMRQVINARMEGLGKSIVTDAAKSVGKGMSAKTKAVEKIDKEVEKLSKLMRAEKNRIKLAQDVIDSLTCK